MAAMQLTRTHRILIGVVVAGAVVIAAIGFAGSYAAVRELAEKKGFGDFSLVFPIGIDAGICVLLALDLLLTWIRIPFPLLRQTAWLLTAATIAFNGAAAWPDPLGVGMHAVIPVLFVVAVEAARHAVGRIADITADKHMEGVRLTRWLLSPVPTFRLWRRMKLWELRSYEQVIKLEQDRLIYQARLQARFGRAWRRKAPVEALMPLRLAKYGVPLAETAPAGLAAAGIDPGPSPVEHHDVPALEAELGDEHQRAFDPNEPSPATPRPHLQESVSHPTTQQQPLNGSGPDHQNPRFTAPQIPRQTYRSSDDPTIGEDMTPVTVTTPASRHHPAGRRVAVPSATSPEPASAVTPAKEAADLSPNSEQQEKALPLTTVDRYYQAWTDYLQTHETEPKDSALSQFLADRGMYGRDGTPVSPSTLRRYLPAFRIYAAWTQHLEQHGVEPTAEQLAQLLASLGYTGKPYTTPNLEKLLNDFPRRRAALNPRSATPAI
ncbi:DUF2637 domain-containing protein [Streptomyces sp. NPDC054841]